MGDLRIGDRLGDSVHAYNAGFILQDDSIAVLEDLGLCAPNGQEFLGSEDGEKREMNERVDGLHREVWEAFSYSKRVTKERREEARPEESSEPKVPVTVSRKQLPKKTNLNLSAASTASVNATIRLFCFS